MDIMRITQKISQYSKEGGLQIEDLHFIFYKLSKIIGQKKTIFLSQNTQTITREIFEDNIKDIILRRKVIDAGRTINIEIRNGNGNEIIKFNPAIQDEYCSINELTKICYSGKRTFQIESSDYSIRYLLSGDEQQFLQLSPGTRVQFGQS